ncbi:thioredoxin family protein [Shewanella sp. HN-41]|uniref:thioredoxin family protein n=1 Tax=Shewanella sp. HN-41 TaxID=327275 RepID=UPI0002125A40|nr:thioredoxin family protein [Shewanella sp. HN-41]EGM70069.1 redox-active disulfide protein 2 [Shewanella sp. HN-41]
MLNIKVLGSGCSKCTKTAEIITAIANEKGISIALVKETNPEVIMEYKVMSTPAVVIDEKLVHWGSIPHRDMIESWLEG